MAEHVVYCVTHAYGAPFPDAEGRAPRLQVLSVSADGSAMTLVQEVALPVGSGGFMTMQLNVQHQARRLGGRKRSGRLRGRPDQQGPGGGWQTASVLAGHVREHAHSAGRLPRVDLGLLRGVYSCNFFAGTVTALPFDKVTGRCGAPSAVCTPTHPGTPQKALDAIDPNGESGPFGAGFPENGCHPHGIALHPSGKWLVMSDLGSNNFRVYSLPVGDSFKVGPPDFTLAAHTAPDSNICYGAGPKNAAFSSDGRVLFSCNELDSSVSAYRFDDQTGELTPCGSPCMALPQSWLDSVPPRPLPFYDQCHSGGSLCLAPDGKHLYASNRGHDSVACFAVGADGALSPTAQFTVPAGGRISWNLTMPSNTLLVVCNQYADDPEARSGDGKGDPKRVAPPPKGPGNLRVFSRDPATGELTPSGCVYEVDEPSTLVAAVRPKLYP